MPTYPAGHRTSRTVWVATAGIVLTLVGLWAFRQQHLDTEHPKAGQRTTLSAQPAPGPSPSGGADGQPSDDDNPRSKPSTGDVPSDNAGDPWPPKSSDELTPDEHKRLMDALAQAERTPVAALVKDVIDNLDPRDGRDLAFKAWMLAWSLSKDPRGLTEMERAIMGALGDRESVKVLLVIVGEVATTEARDCLLRMLDHKTMSPYEVDVLNALNQFKITEVGQLSAFFYDYLHDDKGPWAPCYLGNIMPSSDPVVVSVEARLFTGSTSEQVRREAAGLLRDASLPQRQAQIDDRTRNALYEAFLQVLRDSTDEKLTEIAVGYLANSDRPDAEAVFWDRLSRSDPQAKLYQFYACAAASHAQCAADVYRAVEAGRAVPDQGVRQSMLGDLRHYLHRAPEGERPQLAEAIAGWAKADPDESVRMRGLDTLGELYPEAAPLMEWAREDPSLSVRAKLDEVLKQAELTSRYHRDTEKNR